MKYQAPRGTNDILPADTPIWQQVERTFASLCRRYGFHELRTPIFEETDLFTRSMGEHTDVVSKEMYVFTDRGGRSLALKPEGTAPAVRAYVQHSLGSRWPEARLYYVTPIFRYERPQAGRYRQAHQVGVEVLGSASAFVDAEVIALAMDFYSELGVTALSLVLNSVGCPACRPVYREALRTYAAPFRDALCDACQTRYEHNPLRMLDCKRDVCRERLADSPDILASLCPGCREHFDALCQLLDAQGTPYRIDKNLVRGFDYYTRTAFEIQSDALGAQNALGGGGRYDGLVEEVGGAPTPGIGFALGIERAIMVMKQLGVADSAETPLDVYVCSVGAGVGAITLRVLQSLRHEGIAVQTDTQGRSLKSQMKQADRYGARITVLIGDDEVAAGAVTLRDMRTREQVTVPIAECAATTRARLAMSGSD